MLLFCGNQAAWLRLALTRMHRRLANWYGGVNLHWLWPSRPRQLVARRRGAGILFAAIMAMAMTYALCFCSPANDFGLQPPWRGCRYSAAGGVTGG